MSAPALPHGPLLRSLSIFNPTLSRGNEERAMDNIIYYYPPADDQNKQMNKVGFCVACACICERFAVRNDGKELVDEIQTEGSITVLFSPQREVWVAAEVDPSVDTLPMRLLLEKVVSSYLLIHGLDGLNIEPPPHKRYVKGSDLEMEKRLEQSTLRKKNIEAFFNQYITFLLANALVSAVSNGPYFEYRSRVAADALLAMPVAVPSFDSNTYFQLEQLTYKFGHSLLVDEDCIRNEFITGNKDSITSSPITNTEKVFPEAAPRIGRQDLHFVIFSIDDARLLYSSSSDYLTHRLTFLARTHFQYLDQNFRQKVLWIHYKDLQGQSRRQPMIFCHRSGIGVFIIGPCAEIQNTETSSATIERRSSKEFPNPPSGGTTYETLHSISQSRGALMADLLSCAELLTNHPFAKACELRATALKAETRRITETYLGKPNTKSWAAALKAPTLLNPLGTPVASAIFAPSPVALLSCLRDSPISFTPRPALNRYYPVVPEPQQVISRCSDSQPTIICYNRGLSYGTPLASLPRMAQIAVAHYMSEVWRGHYSSHAFNLHDHVFESPSDFSTADQEMKWHNQTVTHKLIDTINTIRFQGRMTEITGDSRSGKLSGLTLPTLMVDGEKDVSDVWVPIVVKSMIAPNLAATGSGAPTSLASEEGAFGIALLAIAQHNGRVVAVYFPPRNRQGFSEQLAHASTLFNAAFRGTGFV